jgi:hypothetical protein
MMRNTLPPLASNDLFDGAPEYHAPFVLLAHETKAVDVSVRVVLGKFLTFGRHAQSITKAVFKKKSASRDARSRTRPEFNVSTPPEQRAIAIRDIDIRGGRVCFQRAPSRRKKDSSGARIS